VCGVAVGCVAGSTEGGRWQLLLLLLLLVLVLLVLLLLLLVQIAFRGVVEEHRDCTGVGSCSCNWV